MQSLYNRGLIQLEDMAHHPHRNRIYNCLGAEQPPKIKLSDKHELMEGDTILLCSDGVWGGLDDATIKKILHTNTVDMAITELLDTAEFNNGEECDNLSAIGLQWGDRQMSHLAISTVTMLLGATTTIMNPIFDYDKAGNSLNHDLTDDDIENTIAEIQAALSKAKQNRT